MGSQQLAAEGVDIVRRERVATVVPDLEHLASAANDRHLENARPRTRACEEVAADRLGLVGRVGVEPTRDGL
jgi:hypothetical protein